MQFLLCNWKDIQLQPINMCLYKCRNTNIQGRHTHRDRGERGGGRGRERRGQQYSYTNKYKNILLRLWPKTTTTKPTTTEGIGIGIIQLPAHALNQPAPQLSCCVVIAILCRELSTSLLASPNECRHQNSWQQPPTKRATPTTRSSERGTELWQNSADENGTKMKYLTKLTILFIYSKFA